MDFFAARCYLFAGSALPEYHMSQVQTQPTLVEQVVNAIVSEIVDGELPSNSRLIQDELARAYGVSRQPVQQALLLLRDRGLVREAPGRGLIVSPLDVDFVRNLYEIRAMLDGLAGRQAAERGAERAKIEGPAFLEAGRAAVRSGSLHDQIEADMQFHAFIDELVRQSLDWRDHRSPLALSAPRHGRSVARRCSDAADHPGRACHDPRRRDCWRWRAGGALSRDHISQAAKIFVQRLKAQQEASEKEIRQRRTRRIR